MLHPLLAAPTENSLPIWLVTEGTWGSVSSQLPKVAQGFAKAQGFEGKAGNHCLLPDADGNLFGVIFGLAGDDAKQRDPFAIGKLSTILPDGVYRFETDAPDATLATLSWILGSYSFTRYRKRSEKSVRLVVPKGVDAEDVTRIADAVYASRDLVNTPTSDLGPDGIEDAARQIAEKHGAKFNSIVGDDLLKQNFPMIHAVGRASAVPPRLIDFTWGNENAPRITLVGKGVAFDTGGLDIKPASSMLLMRKDIGAKAVLPSGLLQATSLSFIVVGAQIGVTTGELRPINAASMIAAGMLSVLIFPALALLGLRKQPREDAAAPVQFEPFEE